MRGLGLTVVLVIGAALLAIRFDRTSAKCDEPPDKPAQSKAASASQKGESEASAKTSGDEAAIRANVAEFVRAYNAKDAKATAGLFDPHGQVLTEEGETVEGRSAIEAAFAESFADSPDATIEVIVDSIRFIGADLAIEVGSTRETAAPGQTPEYGRYTVLHVKRDGKWSMAMARDTEGEPPTSHERLRPLAWLVGEWIDDGGSTVVHTSCRWSDDKNFLLQEFKVQLAGKDAMRVSQRIGWDPLAKRIRSWVFDTEGGFGEGVWASDGRTWIIKSTGVRPDGTPASSTSIIVPAGKDGYVWRVSDRVAGDEFLTPLEVRIVRKPPTPTSTAKQSK